MGYSVWRPLNAIDTDKYLYHYTTLEKAYNILTSNELWFSDLTTTNDVFEQKVKISFCDLKRNCNGKQNKSNLLSQIQLVHGYMNKSRSRIKLLCFSKDTDLNNEITKKAYNALSNMLSLESKAINVIGRGFSLPRMWAQYASNNCGICFIFNKNSILNKVRRSGHEFMCDNVEYKLCYEPYLFSLNEFKSTYKIINSQHEDAIKILIKKKNNYLKYDLFSKLSDWSSENEYRIVLTPNSGEKIVKLYNINTAIEGIVYGANTDLVNAKIIKYLGCMFDVRRIVYDDIITKIVVDP